MKKVFNNSELAHVWASETQDYGRNTNDSLYFKNDIIYSYGNYFPIARIVSENIVLFTNRDYSHTTAEHKSCVRMAISHKEVIYVDKVLAKTKADHKANIYELEKGISDLIKKQNRARTRDYTELIENSIENYTAYIKNLYLRIKPKFNIDDFIEQNKTFTNKVTKEKEKEKKRKIKAHNKMMKEKEADLKLWIDNIQNIRYTTFYNLPVKLRIKNNGVQTSHGASVPIKDFNLCYKIYKRYPEKLIGCKIGYYTINKIDKKEIVIGCHNIPTKEVERIAKDLKYTQEV